MTTTSFAYTGASQNFVVPANVFTVTMELWGAQGSVSDGGSTDTAGLGGYIKATIPTTPGETLRVHVGGAGGLANGGSVRVGGWNGGGTGGNNSIDGGGGGGASDVRRTPYASANRLIVAGGGGGTGGGASLAFSGKGGGGGYTSGVQGETGNAGVGGGGGTSSAGGAAGGSSLGTPATAGTLDQGGNGWQSGGASGAGGAGGGGFYGGGGGGEEGGGGGGGSSAVIAGTYVDSSNAFWTGNGVVTFNYTESYSIPARTSDIPFLQGNDRYQVVALVDQGTSTTIPEFRYWYAGSPLWDQALASDSAYPPFHTLDEFETYTPGSLELPFKDIKVGQEMQVDGLLVEYIPRPTSLTETDLTSAMVVGFTARVEGIGATGYSRTVGTHVSGLAVSTSQTYSSTAGVQDATAWPNTKVAHLHCSLTGKVTAARVIFTDIHLCKIRRVRLLGKTMPMRDT